jgi:hypothetical protein
LTNGLTHQLGLPPERCYHEQPKELFEAALCRKKRRKPLPEDFAVVGAAANLTKWCRSETFARLVQVLRAWFPRDGGD